MDKQTAFLFPGQGAQYTNMALDLLESDAVKSLFYTASEILEKDIKEYLCSDSDTLKKTDISQPAITAANLAAAVFLKDKGYYPSACAGFSLGEYAALVNAGVINEADCFRLVKTRGNAMQKTINKILETNEKDSSAAPGMAAITGFPIEQLENLIAQLTENGLNDLYIANINSPKQLVISGTAAALNEAEIRLKESGIRRFIRLPVAGPFHSPLMSDASGEFLSVLETIVFNNPLIPVYSNVTGNKISTGLEAKELAVKQITNPVRWIKEEMAIAASGIEICLEVGPGSVLQGLWKDLKSDIPIYAAGTAEDINKWIAFS